ncbi:hypothetical protein [Accumulibacter sp.]|uniref:Transposase n=1 Tax=Accumulibacter regalis TaxID=522306 RepID=C7RLH3_ACCRE|nr:hypothetical protein [Accumulibacter sp.]
MIEPPRLDTPVCRDPDDDAVLALALAAQVGITCEEKHTPFGVVNEGSRSLHRPFGSSARTRDLVIDSLYAWWERQAPEACARFTHIQNKGDNELESNCWRTQCIKRLIEFADYIGKSIRGLYYPPYHSRYDPVQRCGGILGKHWICAKLTNTQTMMEWTKSMTSEGVHPVVELSRTAYEKGVAVAKDAMQECRGQARKKCTFPKRDILIRLACLV